MIVILEEKRSAAASMYTWVGALVHCLLRTRHNNKYYAKSAKKCKKVIDNIILFCYTHNKRYE